MPCCLRFFGNMSVFGYSVFLVCVIFCCVAHAKQVHRMSKNFINMTTEADNPTKKEIAHVEDIRKQANGLLNITEDIISNSSRNSSYSKWSQWSRCEHCYQVRLKECLVAKCRHSKVYEERPCDKKRCKRKAKQKPKFNIVHLNQENRHHLRQGYASRIWSRWSEWSPCSSHCRSYRYRVCRKPGRCKKKRQTQNAYCYHTNTTCEHYVLNLLDSSNRRTDVEGNRKYEYGSNFVNDFDYNPVHWKPKKCGRPFKKSGMMKIIGGVEAKKYKWPWHVAVINIYMEVFCAGTLIAPRWVLTAGHCIRNYLKVRLNEHNLRARDGRELEMVVRSMYIHPKFNHRTVDNDIAMLKMPRAVKMPVACLPSRPPVPMEMCSIMGWGKVKSTDVYGTDVLHEAKIPVVSRETCKRSYKQFMLTTNMFCAGWPSGAADTCAGDSGGGLMCRVNEKKRSSPYTVQGITSFGDGCGRKNKYGIYTMVYNYRTWIKYVMEHYA